MIAVVCVCHKGEMELKTAFLIHTFRKYVDGDYRFYVGIPIANKHVNPPSKQFMDYCKNQHIINFTFNNKFLESIDILNNGDLISNKVYLWQYEFIEKYIIFFDSDILVIRNFNIESIIKGVNRIAVKPANHANVHQWKLIYNETNIEIPVKQIESRVSHKMMLPYFNSGVIIFNIKSYKEITQKWKNYYEFFSDKKIYNKIKYPYYHRDQIALTLAINSKKDKYSLLEDIYNYPVKRMIMSNDLPIIGHYHHPFAIYFERSIRREFIKFIRKYPEFINNGAEVWKNLFARGLFIEKKTAWIEFFKYKRNYILHNLNKKLRR